MTIEGYLRWMKDHPVKKKRGRPKSYKVKKLGKIINGEYVE